MKKIIVFALAAILVVAMSAGLVSAAGTNVAKGKTYIYTGAYTNPGATEISYPDTGNTELTDGIIGTASDIGYAAPIWVGINTNAANAIEAKQNEIVLNLGNVTDGITNFVAYTETCAGGIATPSEIEVFVSTDNVEFTSVGKTTSEIIFSGTDTGIYKNTLAVAAKAQYVKFLITHASSWVFVSEIEVLTGGSDTPAPADTSSTAAVTSSAAASSAINSTSSTASANTSSKPATSSTAATSSKPATSSKASSTVSDTSETEPNNTGLIIGIVAGVVVVVGVAAFLLTRKKK